MRTPTEIENDIRSHPERDDLRLELAHAIETSDPQRSKFIFRCFDPNWSSARFFQPDDELEARLEAPFRHFGNVRVEFERGFPTTASLPLATFLEHGEEIMSLAPILEVRLGLPALDEDGYRPHWKAHVADLAKCTALSRVRQLLLGLGTFDFACATELLSSPHAENLLDVRFAVAWRFDSDTVRNQQEDELWSVLLERPAFRRMIDWGISGQTRRYFGDRMSKEYYPHYDETTRCIITYEPMDEASRAVEQKYGYIPSIHAGNWNATVLDVLRGIKPDFPAGATPTEEMYTVPPPKDVHA